MRKLSRCRTFSAQLITDCTIDDLVASIVSVVAVKKERRAATDVVGIHYFLCSNGEGARRMERRRVRQVRRNYINVVVYNLYQRLLRIYLKLPCLRWHK
jgi:formyltetrahydrofolate hydrolase